MPFYRPHTRNTVIFSWNRRRSYQPRSSLFLLLYEHQDGGFEFIIYDFLCPDRKFDILLSILDEELGDLDIATWTRPHGGYFSSLDVRDGCATRVYELCRRAGVTLTKVGATFPYGRDPHDRNLRLAPSFAKDADLAKAAHVLAVAVRLATLEDILPV